MLIKKRDINAESALVVERMNARLAAIEMIIEPVAPKGWVVRGLYSKHSVRFAALGDAIDMALELLIDEAKRERLHCGYCRPE